MQIKDKISISISILALGLSIFATVNTEIKARYEKDRIIRNQLTDVLGRITLTREKQAKYFKDFAQSDFDHYQNLSLIIGQENGFLLQQAMYLSKQIPDLTSSVDLNTIAIANLDAGDLVMAENFFKEAIDRSENNQYKAIALRNYGSFLFQQRNFIEGREQYQESVSVLKGADDLVRFTNGLTYQIWAVYESDSGSSSAEVDRIFADAKREFSGISNESVKSQAFKGLEAAKKRATKNKATMP